MLQERVSASYQLYDGPQGGAVNGILYAVPIAAALWAAIAATIVFLVW